VNDGLRGRASLDIFEKHGALGESAMFETEQEIALRFKKDLQQHLINSRTVRDFFRLFDCWFDWIFPTFITSLLSTK
jgi:hypothetical protein